MPLQPEVFNVPLDGRPVNSENVLSLACQVAATDLDAVKIRFNGSLGHPSDKAVPPEIFNQAIHCQSLPSVLTRPYPSSSCNCFWIAFMASASLGLIPNSSKSL
ncbi:Uncharacterised protein [uncultured archaeon]|nr:Uncharacterised protein [uncultured archaeon]